MAISAATVFEVRTAGADTSGGGFVAGASGTDRSQSDTPFANGTNLTVDATTNTDVAPDGYSPVAGDVGNLIQITAGAGFTTGFYQISSIQSGKWRLDRSPAATGTSGGTWAMGGALASPGMAFSGAVASNTIWVKSGTYTISSSSSNVSNGRLTVSVALYLRGYSATRGDLTPFGAGRPTIKAGVNTINIMTLSTPGYIISGVIFDGDKASRSGTVGTSGSSEGVWFNCVWKNCNGKGLNTSNAIISFCEAADDGDTNITCKSAVFCVSHGSLNGGNGFGSGAAGSFVNCLSYANTGKGFGVANTNFTISGCVAQGNTQSGVDCGADDVTVINSIFDSNSAYGVDDAGRSTIQLLYCAFRSNTSGATRNTLATGQNIGAITLTANPFTNTGTGDFSINNTAGGGAALRGLGFGNLGTTVGYPDVGVAQHLQPTSGVSRLINGGLIG